MDLELDDRACIVTGGSRGIGRATARRLVTEGARVLIVGRSSDALEEAAAGSGGRIATLAIDVTGQGAAKRIVETCTERFGRIDVLVNNAGTSRAVPVEELEDADWNEQWELHVMAPMHLMRLAAPAMAQAGWGRIVNVCSSSGKRPSLRNMAYSVTKAAQLSLSRAYADTWAARGVLVNAIAPGVVGTGLWMDEGGMADQVAEAEGKTREEVIAGLGAKVPLGRIGTEDEIASAIAFLCSERSSYVTGAAWSVDGGSVSTIV